MSFNLVLKGAPISTQHIYRIACKPYPSMYLTPAGKNLRDAYRWQAIAQWKRPVLTEPLQLTAVFYFSDRRIRDLDNQNKLWIDAMTGVVFEDDSLIHSLLLRKDYDKDNPRIEIVVSPGG